MKSKVGLGRVSGKFVVMGLIMGLLAGLMVSCQRSSDTPPPDTVAPVTPDPNDPVDPNTPNPLPVPSAASRQMTLEVPQALRYGTFSQTRRLRVPTGFDISLYAQVPEARFLAVAPNGDVLVSQPGFEPYAGKVTLLRKTAGVPQSYTFIAGLNRPHDILFHKQDGTDYVYIAEAHRVRRYRYSSGDTSAGAAETLIDNLPNDSSIGRAYGHVLKNIAIDSQDRIYVANASACNACAADAYSEPKRGAIYRYDKNGNNRELFAEGIRNATGLEFVPGTDNLWVTMNNRDYIRYPFRNDFDGDGSVDYGKILPAYVDNHPPDGLSLIKQGANYGWPFCNPNPDKGLKNMPLDVDVETNENEREFDCSTATPTTQGIQAHSVALGLAFLQAAKLPEAYRQGVAVAYKGSFNRSSKTGYKVALFPWRNGNTTQQLDLVSGWLDESSQTAWGRPVDVVVDNDGSLLISDEEAGAVYRLRYTGN